MRSNSVRIGIILVAVWAFSSCYWQAGEPQQGSLGVSVQLPAELSRLGVGSSHLNVLEESSCPVPWIVAMAMDGQLIESYPTDIVDIYDYAFTEATVSIVTDILPGLEADLNDPQVVADLQNELRTELYETFFAEPAENVSRSEILRLTSLAAAPLLGATTGTIQFPGLPAGRSYFVTAEIWVADPNQDCLPTRYTAAVTASVSDGRTTSVALQPRSTRADIYSALIGEYGVPVYSRHPANGSISFSASQQDPEPTEVSWVVREFRQELSPDAAGNRVFRHHLFVLDETATYDPASQFNPNALGSGRVSPATGVFAELSWDTNEFLFDDWLLVPAEELNLNSFQDEAPPSVKLARASFGAGDVVIDAEEADSQEPYFEFELDYADSAVLNFDFDGASDSEGNLQYTFGSICFEDKRGLISTSCSPSAGNEE